MDFYFFYYGKHQVFRVLKNMFSRGQMISNEVYTFISNFDKATPEERASLISPNPMQVIFKNNIYGYRL